jgi:Protein of unknown function (DUF3780)
MAANARGFGYDEADSPYHFALAIPRSPAGTVSIEERWLTERGAPHPPRPPVRLAEVPRAAWEVLAGAVREEFNRRLRRQGKRSGEFHEGENLLTPYLGKELVLLLWAAEGADATVLDAVVANWRGLAPEERWWLFTTADASRDHPGHGPNRGWRKAIKVAFAENPVVALPAGQRRIVPKPRSATSDNGRGTRPPKKQTQDVDPAHQLPLLEEAT